MLQKRKRNTTTSVVCFCKKTKEIPCWASLNHDIISLVLYLECKVETTIRESPGPGSAPALVGVLPGTPQLVLVPDG